jgi:hypothetical protein
MISLTKLMHARETCKTRFPGHRAGFDENQSTLQLGFSLDDNEQSQSLTVKLICNKVIMLFVLKSELSELILHVASTCMHKPCVVGGYLNQFYMTPSHQIKYWQVFIINACITSHPCTGTI